MTKIRESTGYDHTYVYNAIGNLTSYAGNSDTYGSSKPHAVTAAYGNSYGYDNNGNQTGRTIGGTAYTVVFDYENRLTEVKQGSTTLASFIYDADGNRVKGTLGGVTTVYVGGLFEYQNGGRTKYYEGHNGVVAFRRVGYSSGNGIFYILNDQLRSTSTVINQAGAVQANQYYYPYGGNRGGAYSSLTTKRFTGQYHESGLPGGEGLYYYNARWYDAKLGRFASPDTLVPQPANPQALNRFSYALNNPVRYSDPTGHYIFEDEPTRTNYPVNRFVYTSNYFLNPIESRRIYGVFTPMRVRMSSVIDPTGEGLGWILGYVAGVTQFAMSKPPSRFMGSPQVRNLPQGAYRDAVGDPGPTGINGSISFSGGRVPLMGGGTNLPQNFSGYNRKVAGEWVNVNELDVIHGPEGKGGSGFDVPTLKQRIATQGFDPLEAIPVVRTINNRLIILGGHHRLEAVKQLGYDYIPARVIIEQPNDPMSSHFRNIEWAADYYKRISAQ